MSAPDRPHLLLREVSTEGLDSDTAATAEREVRGQFELARGYDIALRQLAEVTVQITADLAAKVDRFNLDHGIPAPPYRRLRPDGTSVGIVLTVPEDTSPNRHVIVIDAALWAVQSDCHVVHRAHGLAYLVGHLLNRFDRDRTGHDAPGFDGVHAESLWRTSLALCSVWDDSVIALDFCNACLRNLDGQPIRLLDHLGPDSLQGVSELLDQLCVFSAFDVAFYRVFAMDLEALYPTAMNLVCGLLRAAVRLIALCDADQRIEDVKRAMSAMNGFGEFLDPVWSRVLAGCMSGKQVERIDAFSIAITELLCCLGLRIEDQKEGGLFVHVHEPVACSWEEQTEDLS